MVFLIISMFFLFKGTEAAIYDCYNCTDCSQKIQQAGSYETIRLMQNISDIAGNCIEFYGQDNVTFDCKGFPISGDNDNTGIGIWLNDSNGGSNNNTITGCTNISYFGEGVYLQGSSGNNISNMTIIDAYEGIEFGNSHNNTISNITFESSDMDMFLQLSDNNNITNIISSNSLDTGLYLLWADENKFHNITIIENQFEGIHLDWSDYNNLSNLTIASDSQIIAVHLVSSANNTITNTSITLSITDPVNDQAGFFAMDCGPGDKNNIDESVAINGKPVKFFDGYYSACPNNQVLFYNNTYSQLTLVGCSNVTVVNTSLPDSLALIGTSNSRFYNIESINGTIELNESDNNIFVNTTTSGVTWEGESLCIFNSSDNNTLVDANAYYFGFFIGGNNNTLINVTSSDSCVGLQIIEGDNNTITNLTSIRIKDIGCAGVYGIHFHKDSEYNKINDSFVQGYDYGIRFSHQSTLKPQFNMIYNCFFNNSDNYINTTFVKNYFNTTLQSGTNIIGGSWVGGNYWITPANTGFSDNCTDSDKNSICDTSYSLDGDNFDYLSLKGLCTENWVYGEWSSCYDNAQSRTATDLNNCGTTDNLSITIQPCTTSTGGGSPGGGSTNNTMRNTTLEKETFVKKLIMVTRNDTVIVEINRTDIDVAKIILVVNVTVQSAEIRVRKLESKPPEVQRVPAANVYTYVEINKTMIRDEDINYSKIMFRVNKTWIQKHNINRSTVMLMRFNRSWENLTTKLIDERLDYLEYEAETSGFSIFAVTGLPNTGPEVLPICIYNTTRCYGRFIERCDGLEWVPVKECDFACLNAVCVEKEYYEVIADWILLVLMLAGIAVGIYFLWKYRKKIFRKKTIGGDDLFDKVSSQYKEISNNIDNDKLRKRRRYQPQGS